MKKPLLSLVALVAVTIGVYATGDFANNQQQTGQITLTTFTGSTWTNVFPIPYTVVPIVIITPTATNGAPYTITSTTTTNFVVSSTANTPTNCTFFWSANLPYTRIETGTNTVVTATPLVVTFPVAYYSPPIVVGTFSTTNANGTLAINPQSTTTTNFTILENLGGIATWMSIGSCVINGTTEVVY